MLGSGLLSFVNFHPEFNLLAFIVFSRMKVTRKPYIERFELLIVSFTEIQYNLCIPGFKAAHKTTDDVVCVCVCVYRYSILQPPSVWHTGEVPNMTP